MTKFAQDLADVLIDCFNDGNKVLVCGNGGSAAEAQHLSAELVGHFEKSRLALPAIALTTDSSILTAVGNDNGFDSVFSRQIEALGKKGDILIILTTSGKSQNCLAAEVTARKKQMKVRYFPLRGDGTTAECQELHLQIIHDVCRQIDKYYAN